MRKRVLTRGPDIYSLLYIDAILVSILIQKIRPMTNILEKLTRSYALLFVVFVALPSILRVIESL